MLQDVTSVLTSDTKYIKIHGTQIGTHLPNIFLFCAAALRLHKSLLLCIVELGIAGRRGCTGTTTYITSKQRKNRCIWSSILETQIVHVLFTCFCFVYIQHVYHVIPWFKWSANTAVALEIWEKLGFLRMTISFSSPSLIVVTNLGRTSVFQKSGFQVVERELLWTSCIWDAYVHAPMFFGSSWHHITSQTEDAKNSPIKKSRHETASKKKRSIYIYVIWLCDMHIYCMQMHSHAHILCANSKWTWQL